MLGAGVMGAQIAAHLANANVPVVLFDLPAKEGNPSGIAAKAIENLKRLEPSPLATRDRVEWIQPANYDQHVAELATCDLVIEAIAERLDWKRDLYAKVAAHVAPHAVFASNTSTLPISGLAQASKRPAQFIGVHFFSPVEKMPLVEIIVGKKTSEETLARALDYVAQLRVTPRYVATAERGDGFAEIARAILGAR